MKLIYKLFIISLLLLSFQQCGPEKEDLKAKKESFKAKQSQLEQLKIEISSLRKEIEKEDPDFFKDDIKKVLVTTVSARKQQFEHFAEVSGVVKADQNVTLTPKTSGIVTGIFVKEGQYVRQGQSLMQQDAEVIVQNINQLKTSLELAETVYQKQERLWKQNVGTELQYLQAKNNKENLEQNIKVLQAQLAQTTLTAPFSGYVDKIFAKNGEMASPGMPALRLVSLNKVEVEADISEKYLGKLRKGDEVSVEFPNVDATQKAKILNVSQVLNPENRTFKITVGIKNPENLIKPELLALVKFKDFELDSAVVIPRNLVQEDFNGQYVYIVDNQRAKRVSVERGVGYQKDVVIEKGLEGSEILINEGARFVKDNTPIEIKESK